MLLDVLSALFLTHVVHAANVKTNQRRFAPTLPHIAGITGPLHRNTQFAGPRDIFILLLAKLSSERRTSLRFELVGRFSTAAGRVWVTTDSHR